MAAKSPAASENRVFADILKRPAGMVFGLFVVAGALCFIAGAVGSHPERAWRAYLINFLLWSGIAQGGLLFSAIMQVAGARWSGRMAGIAEAFTAFFPFSFVLFLGLFAGSRHLFPWMGHDLHGKEVWLNLPFLFTRDCIGLFLLYGIGFAYLYHSLQLRLEAAPKSGGLRKRLTERWARKKTPGPVVRERLTRLGILYCLCFALVLSLLGFDLVMAMDPHWISTLFGAYSFIKPVYIGLGGLIVLASILQIRYGDRTGLRRSDFHDVGKLFFAFGLVWADFFYAQLVVIWYGNIPEETAYVIERTVTGPWNRLAWIVLAVCFVGPFLILLNRKIKTVPPAMTVLCGLVIAGMWLEHLLLVGPALNHGAGALALGLPEILITLGFLGLMAWALMLFMNLFPEIARVREGEGR